jgi:hypothetical protein
LLAVSLVRDRSHDARKIAALPPDKAGTTRLPSIFKRFQIQTAYWSQRYRERYANRPVNTLFLTYLAALGIAVGLWLLIFLYSAYMVRAHVNHLADLAEDPEAIELTSRQIEHLHATVSSLDRNTKRLERLTHLPLVEPALYRVPEVGPRYEAIRTLLKIGDELGTAARIGSNIGHDTYSAFDRTGISHDPEVEEDSWLTAIDRHRDEIPTIAQSIEQAREHRASLNEELLHGSVRERTEALDSFLRRSDELIELADNYDEFFYAAGGNGSIRYLFLFKNPAELRPSGGFPGTFGVFEFNAGQLVGYEMWDSHEVTRNHIEHRSEKLPQPWPFEQYAPQDGLLLHDATWYSDFPYTAELMMEMYAETTWPEINGIVAVHPEAVSEMVHVTGPVEVEIDGEMREINEDNVYDEVERYRWLRFQGEREGVLGDHKDILIDIGEAIMDEFTSSDGTDVTEAMTLLMDAATRRDLQIYVDDPGVQAFLDRRGWTGKLFPDPETPTIAITYTNFILEKASMAMDPSYDLHLVPNEDGSYRVIMHMMLEHTGLHDQDPRYFGFQRWWIEVALPEDSEWLSASHEQQPDPESHNGGSYSIDLFPEETREIYVVFTLPETDRLMLRRQPGQVPPDVNVHTPGCDPEWGGYLVRDLYIELDGECPVIRNIEDEKPEMLQLS